jgi:hypothetical protein
MHVGRAVAAVATMLVLMGLTPLRAYSNGAPIAGVVKSVDVAANTFVVESTARGRTRQVTIHVRPASKIVRFQRAAESGQSGFKEQAAMLADLKAGWTVSVRTIHEGDKEIAELVRVVHEP